MKLAQKKPKPKLTQARSKPCQSAYWEPFKTLSGLGNHQHKMWDEELGGFLCSGYWTSFRCTVHDNHTIVAYKCQLTKSRSSQFSDEKEVTISKAEPKLGHQSFCARKNLRINSKASRLNSPSKEFVCLDHNGADLTTTMLTRSGGVGYSLFAAWTLLTLDPQYSKVLGMLLPDKDRQY